MPLTKEDLGQIEGIVEKAVDNVIDRRGLATKAELERAVSGLATKAKLERAVSGLATKADVQSIVSGEIAIVRGEIRGLRDMLEEDAAAESKRLDRVDKRSLKTQRLLNLHIAGKGV